MDYEIIHKKGVSIMDLNTADTVIKIINSVGFPIACAIALFWLNYKQMKQHREETKELMQVINKNTESVDRLSEFVSDLRNNIKEM